MNLFQNEIEQQAINRIQKFAKIAEVMGFEICLGFSGGKDSQVCFDLCKRAGINFKAYYNHAFESHVTRKFIRENYPEVIRRRDYKFGFIENIYVNHHGFLPTVEAAYCCAEYKHNPKYVDKCSIVGVRKAESFRRRARTTFEIKNKTLLKENKDLIDSYFEEHCQSTGTSSIIQLKPIIDWTDNDVWDYMRKYKLPINPEYKHSKRVGCLVCPKANIKSNAYYLIQMPGLIDAFIRARKYEDINWIITNDNKDYTDDKVQYIIRWLNHSFSPFTKSQYEIYLKIREAYNEYKFNKGNKP